MLKYLLPTHAVLGLARVVPLAGVTVKSPDSADTSEASSGLRCVTSGLPGLGHPSVPLCSLGRQRSRFLFAGNQKS